MTIMIDGLECWDDVGPKICHVCGKDSHHYSIKWDSEFCKNCNVWLSSRCSVTKEENEKAEEKYGHPECHFNCWDRPERPFEDK